MIVIAILAPEIAALLMVDTSGFKVPMIMVLKAPSQTYEMTNVAKATIPNPEVAELIVLTAACDIGTKLCIACEG